MLRKQSYLSAFLVLFFSVTLPVLFHIPSFAAGKGTTKIIVEDPVVMDDGKAHSCIVLSNTEEEICKFTLDLRFDTEVLQYSSFTRGDLAPSPSFPLWDVNPDVIDNPGVVRTGGIDDSFHCIPPQSTGTLACYEFDLLDPNGKSFLQLENLTGQLAGIKVKHKGKLRKKPGGGK